MGSTYYITGAQIGIISAMLDMNNPDEIRDLIVELIENQEIKRECRTPKA